MLKIMSRSSQNSTICVSIGMARCGVRPVVLMPNFRSRGRWRWIISHHLDQVVAGGRLAAGDVEVLDRSPERDG